MEKQQQRRPHVLMFPFPTQGHVTPMLNLALLLLNHAGVHVTFLNTEYNHRRLTQLQALSARFPTLRFESIPDGLLPNEPRLLHPVYHASFLQSTINPHLRDLLVTLTRKDKDEDSPNSARPPPLSCVIADEMMPFVIEAADELQIRVMAMSVMSASGLWCVYCGPDLIQKGELPFRDEDLDKKLNGVPGMEGLLRRRDLPHLWRDPTIVDNPILRFFIQKMQALTRTSALILNTFDAIEGSIVSHIAPRFPKIYTIGPVHSLLKSRVRDDNLLQSSNATSLHQTDRSCMTWLDSQLPGSVIFVCFGSLVKLTSDEMLEFWYGLVNSGKPFLWVVRLSDVFLDEQGNKGINIPAELEVGTKEKGYIVDWAPQEEVLAHDTVGGFLTHNGWNSTLEGIFAGVPMICWPQLADQPVIRRLVCDVWKIGVDMEGTCDRSTVEKMVRTLMEDRMEEISKSAARFAKSARDAVIEGGSSYQRLDKLIQDLQEYLI